MKDQDDWVAVRRVYAQTRSVSATARILSMSRITAQKLLDMEEPPVSIKRSYPTKLDQYKAQVDIWRKDPFHYTGTRIFQELQKMGYTGSIGPVYRYLKQVKEQEDVPEEEQTHA